MNYLADNAKPSLHTNSYIDEFAWNYMEMRIVIYIMCTNKTWMDNYIHSGFQYVVSKLANKSKLRGFY